MRAPYRALRCAWRVQAEEIVELCDSAERLFKQEKSVLELKASAVRWGGSAQGLGGGAAVSRVWRAALVATMAAGS
jgi:hypothetical protein